MIFVIEGLDRTGKTTLARQLADTHGLPYRHFSKPEQHPLDEYCRPIEQLRRTVFAELENQPGPVRRLRAIG